MTLGFLAGIGIVLAIAFFWCWGFVTGFWIGRRTMKRDLMPFLPREPDGNFPFKEAR